jgi:hypothetical protein
MKKRVILKFKIIENESQLVLCRSWEYEILPVGTRFSIWEIVGEVVSFDYSETDNCVLDIIVQIKKPISMDNSSYIKNKMRRYGFE